VDRKERWRASSQLNLKEVRATINPQTILITGATKGIGRHAALHLARAGHNVVATGRNAEALAALRTEAAGLRLDVVRLDVTDRASLAQAVTDVARLTSDRGVDALVNNAGYGEMAPMLEVREADVRGNV
jgi:NAD(P)-dependent dehydrogenase (short-subunit alcohol dehydrogenase family)